MGYEYVNMETQEQKEGPDTLPYILTYPKLLKGFRIIPVSADKMPKLEWLKETPQVLSGLVEILPSRLRKQVSTGRGQMSYRHTLHRLTYTFTIAAQI